MEPHQQTFTKVVVHGYLKVHMSRWGFVYWLSYLSVLLISSNCIYFWDKNKDIPQNSRWWVWMNFNTLLRLCWTCPFCNLFSYLVNYSCILSVPKPQPSLHSYIELLFNELFVCLMVYLMRHEVMNLLLVIFLLQNDISRIKLNRSLTNIKMLHWIKTSLQQLYQESNMEQMYLM